MLLSEFRGSRSSEDAKKHICQYCNEYKIKEKGQ